MLSSRWARYFVAVLAMAVALLVKWALGPALLPGPLLPFYGAVLVASWFGGVGPGVLVTLAAAAVTSQPGLVRSSFPAPSITMLLLRQDLFVVVGTALSWITAHFSRLQGELEARVAERTAELSSANLHLHREIADRRQAEERFRSAFEHAPIGMALVSLDGRLLRVNGAMCSMLGYTQEEFRSKPVCEFTHSEDMLATIDQLQRLVAGEIERWELEKRYFHNDGRLIWGWSTTSLVRDWEGTPLYVISQVRDITARKQAEAALQEERNFVSAVVDTVGALVGVVDRDGRIVRFNRACERALGYSAAEVIGRHFWDLLPVAEEIGPAKAVFEKVVAGQWPQEYETYWFKRDGTPCLLVWSTSFLRDEQGAVQYVIGCGSDITARKHAEEMLHRAHEELEARVTQRTGELARANARLLQEIGQRREAEEQIRREKEFSEHLINSSVDGILAFDPEYRYTLWNPGMERIIGLPAAAVLGQCAFDVLPFLREIGQQAVFDEVLRGNATTAPVRPYVRPATGERGFFEGHYSPLFNEAGATIGGLAIVHDVTERKQAEDKLASLTKRVVSLLESMTAGFFAVDNELRFTYVNRGAEQIVQRSREALLGKKVLEVFPELVNSILYRQYERLMAERTAVESQGYYPRLHGWFRAKMYPIDNGISTLLEDITDLHAREMSTVSEILRALNAEIDVAQAYRGVAAGVQSLTQCDWSALGLFDAQQEWVTVIALDQAEVPFAVGTRVPLAHFPGASKVVAGEPHIVPDLAAERESPAVQRVLNDGFRSGLGVPLHGTERVLGMLLLLWRPPGGGSTTQLSLLAQIADAVALAVERSRLFAEVGSGRARLQALSRRLMEVQEAERQHIARELHDEIGQHLTGLKLLLESLERLPAEAALDQLAEAHQLIDDLVGRVRDLSLDLRPAMLDDLGLLPAYLWLFRRYTGQTDVRVNFTRTGLEERFSPEVETAAYRIVQEALTNVARYAGVSEVAVSARVYDGTLELRVSDDGAGFDCERVSSGQLTGGLAGIRERASLLGGRITIESAPGSGTRLRAELPLRRSQE